MNEPLVYALRIAPRAERDIESHVTQMAETAGAETAGAETAGADIALAWYQGLFAHLASLSQSPHRCALVSENNRFRREVRQLLYRRTATSVVWRILFSIEEASEDAPTVTVLHLRHGAQRPVTRAEARQIENP